MHQCGTRGACLGSVGTPVKAQALSSFFLLTWVSPPPIPRGGPLVSLQRFPVPSPDAGGCLLPFRASEVTDYSKATHTPSAGALGP